MLGVPKASILFSEKTSGNIGEIKVKTYWFWTGTCSINHNRSGKY